MGENCQNAGDKAQKAQKDIREGPGEWYVPGANIGNDFELGRIGGPPEPSKEKQWYVEGYNAFDQPLWRLDWGDWTAIVLPAAEDYGWHLAHKVADGWDMPIELKDWAGMTEDQAKDAAYKSLMEQVDVEMEDLPVMGQDELSRRRDALLDEALAMPEGSERDQALQRLRSYSKQAAIDDGGIGSREMASGDIDVQDVQDRPFMKRILPDTDGQEQKGSTFYMKEDPTAIDPVVTDQRGSDSDEWFQKTRYPTDNGHHRMQITTAPADKDIESTGGKKGRVIATIKGLKGWWEYVQDVGDQIGLFKHVDTGQEQQFPLELIENTSMALPAMESMGADKDFWLKTPTRMPGSDSQPGRKEVPTGEGGVLGIDDGNATATHVVDPAEDEKPVDNFKSSPPASNTRRDWRATTSSRQIGTFRFASSEIFCPPEDELE